MKNRHYQELMTNLETLGLNHMREYVPNYIEVANREELSLTEALLELTRKEVNHQHNQKMNRVIERARFPKRTSLEEFDFTFQPSINKRELLDLKHMGFVEKHENLVFIGSPGVGKTHLTIAFEKGTLERVLNRYARYDVLIIDEIGYLPIQKQDADLFFQLLAMRYEHRSTIITTNIVLSRWGELFQSPEIAAAILDRLVHHVKVFKITGKSYRMRNKI
ncbi:ATP-binding protein [Enterococcus faecium]|uniref:ATP-binding protein n=1 Tax=Enterococcus faecium TaxID=1352 RepID=UPI0010B9A9E2|nr:ATP-binding protein [Enterococcus faecium]MCD5099343.1 ATP-binding protein [Enterococcus faecium]MCD5114532.1 ATP-binding protein [Enterococcus faecium]MDT2301597.1 ATP-binding protein [Enterococcus faecium]BBI26337.1 IstB-like ATP-binding protein [Enterococcus faecium]